MKNNFENTKLIISRRQTKNLKKLLTKAEFSTNVHEQHTVIKCEEPRCGKCDLLITGDTLKLKNGSTWKIKSQMSCKSKDIIYMIICPKCQDSYIGQTQDLRKRVTLHREQIKHEEYRHLPVSKNLFKCNNGTFKIMPIYQCKHGSTKLEREFKEKELITLLKPELNSITT